MFSKNFFLMPLLGQLAAARDSAMCSKLSTADDVASGMNLQHQVAIITGGDSGLGFAAAETFASRGATVLIASHNLQKCQSAAKSIATTTGNPDVLGMELDLSSFASVRDFARQFEEQHGTLNYLLNNAGISGEDQPSVKTKDGFEEVFQINYLSHFLLTELLLPTLRESAAHGAPARIVNTASSAHIVACKSVGAPDDCFKDWSYLPTPTDLEPVKYNGTLRNASTYGISKFAQIQHAGELAIREKANGVQAFSLCPGLVVTGMTNTSRQNFTQTCEMLGPFGMSQDPCPYTAQEGAAVIASCALHATQSGAWYTRYTDCSDDKPVNEQGFRLAMRHTLYQRSLHWAQLDTIGKRIIV